MSNRNEILDDKDFWIRLEYNSSEWLRNSDEPSLRSFWVDGFIPETFANTKHGVDVEGVAWVGDEGRDQQQYQFIVSVPQKLLNSRKKNFSIENLTLDEKGRSVRIVMAAEPQINS